MSYSRRPYGSCHATMGLPPDISPGEVIGKAGSTIKGFTQQSGAGLSVVPDGRYVEISGNADAVRRATELLQQHFEQLKAHKQEQSRRLPGGVCTLLSNALALTLNDELVFVRVTGEVADATGRREGLYALDGFAGGSSSELDALSAMMAGTGLRHSRAEAEIQLEAADGAAVLLTKLQEAVERGCSHSPALDELKLRFNFGKGLFYKGYHKGPWEGQCLSVAELQAQRMPQELKTVSSNAVPEDRLEGCEAWLLEQGFAEIQSKKTVSLHVEEKDTRASYAISFLQGHDGQLSVRKIKSGADRLAFLSLLNPSQQPDWRAKLLGQHHFDDSSVEGGILQDLADSCAPEVEGHTLWVDEGLLAATGFKVTRTRFKSKRVFEGSYAGEVSSVDLRITISTITNGETGHQHVELAGSCPALNTELQSALAEARMTSAQRRAISMTKGVILAFARAATGEMAGY